MDRKNVKENFLVMSSFHEEAVYQLLRSNLSKGEVIGHGSLAFPDIEKTLKERRVSVCFDFHLRQGFKLLGWPENTSVEVKPRFLYDTYERLMNIRKRCIDCGAKISKLVVVVLDERPLKDDFKELSDKLEIISFDNLSSAISNALSKQPLSISKKNTDESVGEKNSSPSYESVPLNRIKRDLSENTISFFLGAGVSASAGVTAWDGLIEQLCVKNDIPKIDSDLDNVVKGRIIVEKYNISNQEFPKDADEEKRLKQYQSDVRDILYAHKGNSDLISALTDIIKKCKTESIISYNYDDLLEQNLLKQGKTCRPIYGKSRPNGELPVYHVHGFIPEDPKAPASAIVLGEKEYHRIYQEPYNWGNVEQLHALNRNTCLFIGLSMTDPNLRRLLDTSVIHSEKDTVHYVFLRKIEHNVELMTQIMQSFGVDCIWYNEHADLPNLLRNLFN